MKYEYEVIYKRDDGTIGGYSGTDKEGESFAMEAFDSEIAMAENCSYEYVATIKKINK